MDEYEDLDTERWLTLYTTQKRHHTLSIADRTRRTTPPQQPTTADKAIASLSPNKPASKAKSDTPKTKEWYNATIIGHEGQGKTRKYHIRWDGYSSDHDTWLHPKDISAAAKKEYHDQLKKIDQPKTAFGPAPQPFTSRLLPKDVINGDYAHIDPFKEMPKDTKLRPVVDPFDISIIPLQDDFTQINPYKDATYSQLISTADDSPPQVKHIGDAYLTRVTRRNYEDLPPSTAIVKSFDTRTMCFTIEHQSDNDTEIVDPETLSQILVSNGTTAEERTQDAINHCFLTALNEAKTHFDDEPKGRKNALKHPESTDILAAEDKEVTNFYKTGVIVDQLISKLPPGTKLLPSHMVYKRKYTIDPTTKENKFTHWRARLVIGGNMQEDYTTSFAATPSWPTIRLTLAYTCLLYTSPSPRD